MNTLKNLFLNLGLAVNQVLHLPRTISGYIRLRQRRTIDQEQECERLDRIRNPSKYLGK